VNEPPLVVKVGGGLLRDRGLAGLRAACAEVGVLAARRRVLVVPGGGPFADAVRELDRRIGLSDAVAHELALRAMDQLGVMLCELLGVGARVTRLGGCPLPVGAAVLEAAPAFRGRPDVPESWAVTSDSLAVLAAVAIGAPEAILLKSVPGILPRWPGDDPPLTALTAAELAARQGGGTGAVDAYLPDAVRRTGVVVTVRSPESRGTRID